MLRIWQSLSAVSVIIAAIVLRAWLNEPSFPYEATCELKYDTFHIIEKTNDEPMFTKSGAFSIINPEHDIIWRREIRDCAIYGCCFNSTYSRIAVTVHCRGRSIDVVYPGVHYVDGKSVDSGPRLEHSELLDWRMRNFQKKEIIVSYDETIGGLVSLELRIVMIFVCVLCWMPFVGWGLEWVDMWNTIELLAKKDKAEQEKARKAKEEQKANQAMMMEVD